MKSRVLGNILCDLDLLDLGVKVKSCIFLVMHPLNHWPLQLQTLQVHRSHDVEGNASCDLDLGSGSNQIFLVNALPPKPLDIEASNFAGA